ncbi:MAG: excinuclease ABC subunit A [Flavobacteriaceae bacterium]|nr:excinuclease ABC subunit A [Flavobacteriaceae bacterium]
MNSTKKNIEYLSLKGARMHNLKGINIDIPKKQFVVITGVSGSGKSSLAFDTIYAEGQRRYVESLSSYARQFLERIEKPKVDKISGLSPAIALEQKISSSNPRSTVGTKTEIYDYIKILFSRFGKTYSPISGKEVKKNKVSEIIDDIKKQSVGDKLIILTKLEDINSGNIEQKIESLINQNYNRIFYENEIIKLNDVKFDRISKYNNLFLVIDRIVRAESDEFLSRVADSLETAIYEGKGKCLVNNLTKSKIKKYNTILEADGIKFTKPDTNFFSFNNPYGACTKCEGYGDIVGIDERLVIPNTSLSLFDDAIFPWRGKKLKKYKSLFIKNSVEYNFPIHKPYFELTNDQKKLLWDGNDKLIGINNFFQKLEAKLYKIQNRVLLSRYRGKTTCNECNGNRLKKEAGYVKINNKNIFDLINMPLNELQLYFESVKITDRITNEIISRVKCLNDLGLGYLTLNRKSSSLSGGESQRINLATCIGSNLTGSLYVLDEPSIGLHSYDTQQLIKIIKRLKNLGNTVLVVEHDDEIIKSADHIIDIGPKAGTFGGQVVAEGSFKKILNSDSLTAKYLNGKITINESKGIRDSKSKIKISGCRENNLKNFNVEIPLNKLVTISGVSGSGKSTLINRILYPSILNHLDDYSLKPGEFDNLSGDLGQIRFVEYISQKAIGKSSRSNPVTYIKAYDDIRKLFSSQRESKIRGYKPKHFSFNVDGGRCETCKGEGTITIEMQFMPDVNLVCDSCNGKRFKNEILEIRINNKNISDILNLTVDDAIIFFNDLGENKIAEKLVVLQKVGLGYIKLGQSSSTLSGGEAQRVKLAFFLSAKNKSKSGLFLFDEPTTGLHFDDIKKLLKSINELIDNGNSVIIIEHNLEIIKSSDHVIDLGPLGGNNGGEIVFQGNLDKLLKSSTITAESLKKSLS